MNYFDLQKQLTELKTQELWLNEINSQSLQASLHNLDDAFTNFLKGRAKFPKFKKKNDDQSFYVPQNIKIENNKLIIPKFKKGIKILLSRNYEGKIKNATVTKNKIGHYYVSVLCEIEKQNLIKKEIKEQTTIGIDLGLKTFLVTSDGLKIQYSKYYRQSLEQLKKLQQIFSKKQKGSNNRKKLNYKISKLYNNIKNKRYDFQQKLSTQLIKNHDTIIAEDLQIKNMLKNHYLALSISDVAWYQFIYMLKYKCEWYGKNFIQIGTFEPSSKLCSNCGWKKKDLKLEERKWICEKCYVVHDRDLNAAKNIKSFGLIRHLSPETYSV